MSKKTKFLNHFFELLASSQVLLATERKLTRENLGTIPLLKIAVQHWSKVFAIAATQKYRFAGIWADEQHNLNRFELTALLESAGEYLLLRTTIELHNPTISSITQHFSGANSMERHIYDMFGIVFVDHPDPKRWTRHQAWSEQQFPLRHDFVAPDLATATTAALTDAAKATTPCSEPATSCPIPTSSTPPDDTYPFARINGHGVYEIPVGPVHAGIIEPGHFRFQAAGEDIINLSIRLGYVHKGIERLAIGRDVFGLARLAARISGDSTVAHTWTACRACENAAHITVPARALFLRAIMVERERIANHLGDFAAICNDVGFSFAYYQLTRLKEEWLRLNLQLFGSRFMMDQIIPGGVNVDLDNNSCSSLQQQILWLKKELDELYPIIENNSSLHDRLKNTGVLSFADASSLGTLGYVGRASGMNFDLRHHAPYPPYDQLQVRVPIYTSGDVLSRTRIRAQEILVALELLTELLTKLPVSPCKIDWQQPKKLVEGIGLIEGWRGEIFAYVRFDEAGKVARFFPRDPSWFSWPALELLIHGNIVPDFPVCNKSINGSYSGVDL